MIKGSEGKKKKKFTFDKIIQKYCDLYRASVNIKKSFSTCNFCAISDRDFDAIRTNRSSVKMSIR